MDISGISCPIGLKTPGAHSTKLPQNIILQVWEQVTQLVKCTHAICSSANSTCSQMLTGLENQSDKQIGLDLINASFEGAQTYTSDSVGPQIILPATKTSSTSPASIQHLSYWECLAADTEKSGDLRPSWNLEYMHICSGESRTNWVHRRSYSQRSA